MGREAQSALVYLICGYLSLVEVRLLQWLACFDFLIFELNLNISLFIFIVCATLQ